MIGFRRSGGRRSVLGPFAASVMLVGMLIGLGQRPAAAAVTAVKGSACGYTAKIGSTGAQTVRGCGQPSGAPATAASPSVALPAGGSATDIAVTDSDGAKAVFGPRPLFGGMWGMDVLTAPVSGPLSVTTRGTAAAGTVTSSADITDWPEPRPVPCWYDEPGDPTCEAPGGFGPAPVEGSSLHVECTASEAAVSGKTVIDGSLAITTDEYGIPYETEGIPSNPPVNYTRSGTLTNPARNVDTPGDITAFTAVFNQHVVNADGSLTVNGVHIYFFGPGAFGDVVLGQVTCGTTPHAAVPADTVAPSCGVPLILFEDPYSPYPTYPLKELIGAVDAGGIQSITNIQAINGTVQVGQPSSSFPHLRFVAGQTGPLQVTATRSDEAEEQNLSMYWSFDVTDKAGNTTRCRGLETPPVAADDAYSTNENAPLTVAAPGVLANDSPAGMWAMVAGGPANGTVVLGENGSFTYTPNPGFSGTDTFTYKANDGSADTNVATVTLTVIPADDPPSCSNATLATDEDVAGSTAPACTDVDEATVSYTVVGQAANGTASVGADGMLIYTPNPDFAGSDSFSYRAQDGNGPSNVAVVTVTVNPVNDAPVAGDDSFGTDEDAALTVPGPGVMANDTDVDSGTLTGGSASQPFYGSVILGTDGSFTYTPDANFHGTDTFTYAADDGQGGTDTALVTITVAAVNDAPLAADDATSTTGGTPVTVPAPGVLGNDTDVDGDPLAAVSASDPAGGSVALSPDGSYTYTPDPRFAGTDTFTYSASDGQGASTVATVTIAVAAAQDLGPTSLSVADVSVAEGDAGPTVATFTVTRSGSASGASTVKYKTGGGTATAGADYTPLSTLATLSFGPGERSRTVTVNVTGDTLPEADETLNLMLSAPAGAVLSDTSGTATIRNDDGAAYLAVDSVTVTEGSSATTPVSFTITRSGNTNGVSTAKYATANGTAGAADFNAVASTPVSFAAGETTKTVTVEVVGDTVDERNETFNLVLSAPVGATTSDTTGTATIVDDEGTITPGPATYLSVGDVSVTEGSSGTTPLTFTVTRSGTTTGASTVRYTTSGGTATAGADYTGVAAGTLLSFAAGETAKTVTVNVTGDTLPEANETFNLALSTPTGAAVADAAGTATILNDDGSAYLTVTDTTVTEGHSGTATATFTVTRSGNTNGASTVKYKTGGGTATAGTDYTAVASLEVGFAPGETSKTVTVDVRGDTLVEPVETFNLTLATPTGATISDASGTAKILNDD